MFNKSFNLTNYVKDVPSMPLRAAIWFSLVGTVNAQLIGAADYIATGLISSGLEPDDLKGLNAREIKALFSGPDGDAATLADSRKLYKLHVEWRKQLLNSSRTVKSRRADGHADERRGSIKASMEFMTGPQTIRDNIEGEKKLASIGVESTPEKREASRLRRLERARNFAAQRATRSGMIEYIIDHLFAANDTPYDDEDDEMYSQLDEQVKEGLCNKLKVCLEKSLQRAEDNTRDGVTGDSQLGIGDYIIAKRLIEEFPTVAYITKESKPKAAKAPRVRKAKAPVVQRAPKPTQATSVTTVSDNGIKITRPVTTA